MNFGSLLFRLANVRCEQCQTQLQMADAKAGSALICPSCQHQMPIEMRGENTAHVQFNKDLVPASEEVTLQREGSISIIEKRWRSKYSKYLIGLALLCDSLWIAAAMWTYINRHDFETPERVVALAIFGLFTLVVFYRALQQLLNTTTIMLKNDKVVVGTAPISWGRVKVYRTDEIASFTVWKINPKKSEAPPQFSFGVDLHTTDGRLEKLCPANDLTEALYIEKTIEELLHIETTPVKKSEDDDVDEFAV